MKKLHPLIKKLDRSIEFEEVSKHRHINCERYEKCLNKACSKNWESFSCIRCPIFKEFRKIRKNLDKKFKRTFYKEEK